MKRGESLKNLQLCGIMAQDYMELKISLRRPLLTYPKSGVIALLQSAYLACPES